MIKNVTLGIFALLLVSIAGCNTMSIPSETNEGQFVIPVETINDLGRDAAFHYIFTIKKQGDSAFKKRVTIYAGKDKELEVISGLEPGRYDIYGYQLNAFKNSNSTYHFNDNLRKLHYSFYVRDDHITVWDKKMKIMLESTDSGTTQHHRFINFSNSEHEDVLNRLEKIDGFDLWRDNILWM